MHMQLINVIVYMRISSIKLIMIYAYRRAACIKSETR